MNVQVGIGFKPVSYLATERLVHSAIGYAIQHKRKSVTFVHKGNIMKFTEGAFRDWGYKVAKDFFGAVEIDGGPWCKIPEGKPGAGLLLKSFARLQNVHPGFESKNVLTMEVALPVLKYPRGKPVIDFYAEVERRVGRVPGVQHVALTSILPLSGTNSDSSFAIEGRDPRADKVYPDE